MRSITVLQKRANRLQEDIKSLLMDNYRYDEELTTRLNIISKISSLRMELATIQREIRERQAAWAGYITTYLLFFSISPISGGVRFSIYWYKLFLRLIVLI